MIKRLGFLNHLIGGRIELIGLRSGLDLDVHRHKFEIFCLKMITDTNPQGTFGFQIGKGVDVGSEIVIREKGKSFHGGNRCFPTFEKGFGTENLVGICLFPNQTEFPITKAGPQQLRIERTKMRHRPTVTVRGFPGKLERDDVGKFHRLRTKRDLKEHFPNPFVLLEKPRLLF